MTRWKGTGENRKGTVIFITTPLKQGTLVAQKDK